MNGTVIEPSRTLPITASCDVLVCGGGIAGVAAALAAARNGARTLLIEREYMLGGLATLGLITVYLPLCDGEGHQASFGIAEELLRLSIEEGIAESEVPTAWLNADGNSDERRRTRYQVQYNAAMCAVAMERLLTDAGVEILYGTLAAQTVVEDGYITAVIVENKSGRSAVSVGTVIDATGDADVCRLAGADCAVYGNKNALAGWYYTASARGIKLHEVGASTSSERYDAIEAGDISRFVQLSHRRSMEHYRRVAAEDPTAVPTLLPTVPQVRMTRRLVGVTTLDDNLSHTRLSTSIGMCGDWRRRGPLFELPFECLYGDKIRNLLAAGRNISVTDAMWDITRVIPVCAVTGQAAGTAAAMSRDIPSLDVTALQARLREAGVRLHSDEVL